MNNELKPCPFCGGTDLTMYSSGIIRADYVVYCNTCNIKTGLGTVKRQSEESVVAAWNRRAHEAQEK